jgi:hypothetical protein
MDMDMDMDMDIFLLLVLVPIGLWVFGYIETPKQAVLILKRNNGNKRLVSDKSETSFGSNFGYIERKLVSYDTLFVPNLLLHPNLEHTAPVVYYNNHLRACSLFYTLC